LVFQILTGLFLTFFYTADGSLAFSTVQYIILEVNYGWIIRIFHFNGASLFFIFLFLHFFKALFFFSYRLNFVWVSGLTIFLLIIIEAFIGYVLVWAQISFWASVVITSLLSVIPYWGPTLVIWIWGGFTVSGATIKFFFVLHFLLPWLLLLLVLFHLIFLHERGSTSKLFCFGDYDKIFFFPFFIFKDSLNIFFWFLFLGWVLLFPYSLGDPEIFIESNFLVSPVHIVPEWYFLFAYAILRAIPNKILGVIALLLRILIFYFFVVINSYSTLFNKLNYFLVRGFFFVGRILSWLGQCLVEEPFVFLRALFSFLYFFSITLLLFIYFITGKIYR
jgi:ubiquinol-cytochrome c reductase cytochrome b subunit